MTYYNGMEVTATLIKVFCHDEKKVYRFYSDEGWGLALACAHDTAKTLTEVGYHVASIANPSKRTVKVMVYEPQEEDE